MTPLRQTRRPSRSASVFLLLSLLAILASGCNFPPPTPVEPSPAVDLPAATVPPEEPEPTPIPGSELIPVDDTWYHYVNPQLGFEMSVPTTMVHGLAGCYWNDADGDHSYRPQAGLVPVVVFETGDRIYITSETYSILTDESEEAGRHFYAGCEEVLNSIELVQTREFPNIFWEIVSRPIASDDDLLTLVHDVYGEACSLGDITPVEGSNFSRVGVESDGLPMEESECVINYAYHFYYQPDMGRAVTWIFGQAYSFYSDTNYMEEPYDLHMIDSFQFLEN